MISVRGSQYIRPSHYSHTFPARTPLEAIENLCETSKDPTRSCNALEERDAAAAAAVKNQVAARVECHHDHTFFLDSLDQYPSLLTDEREALESIIANQTLRASPTLVLVLVANAHPHTDTSHEMLTLSNWIINLVAHTGLAMQSEWLQYL